METVEEKTEAEEKTDTDENENMEEGVEEKTEESAEEKTEPEEEKEEEKPTASLKDKLAELRDMRENTHQFQSAKMGLLVDVILELGEKVKG